MDKNRKKILVLTLLVFLPIILLRNINYTNQNTITYLTAIPNINNILNNIDQTFKILNDEQYKNEIDISINGKSILFKKKSVLINSSQKVHQINYINNDNIISLLKVKLDKIISIKNYNNLDEFKTPINIIKYKNIKIITCNNLEQEMSRNFYYYDIDKDVISIRCTRANEIIFYYRENLYYLGTNFKIDNNQLFDLIDFFIKE